MKVSRYIRNLKGEVTAGVITRNSEHIDFNSLKDLSNTLGYTIYSVPRGVELEFSERGLLIRATGEGHDQVWQFIKGWPMPYECFINGFPFPVEMEQMWKSPKEVEDVDVSELEWNLDYPWWTIDKIAPYNLKPRDVLNHIESFPAHKRRIENSELKYPLLLVETKQNRWLIYDGAHRFLKALLKGDNTIKVQRFSIDEIEEYVKAEDKEMFTLWKEATTSQTPRSHQN